MSAPGAPTTLAEAREQALKLLFDLIIENKAVVEVDAENDTKRVAITLDFDDALAHYVGLEVAASHASFMPGEAERLWAVLDVWQAARVRAADAYHEWDEACKHPEKEGAINARIKLQNARADAETAEEILLTLRKPR